MMQRLSLLILLTFLLVSPGWAGTLEEVLDTLETPFRMDAAAAGETRIADFQANFLQASHIASIDRTQRASGAVSFKFVRRPDGSAGERALFRWEYREPNVQEIVSDGRTMWFYLPENRQVTQTDMSRLEEQQGENPVSFLSSLGQLQRDFEVAWGDPRNDPDGNPVLALRPRTISPYLERLEVVVDGRAVALRREKGRSGTLFPLLSVTATDPHGNRTLITFQQVRINQGLPDSLFQFVPPDGVEVVRPGEQGLGF